MPQKTSAPFWLRVSLILISLIALFVAIPATSAQKPDYSLSSQAPLNAEQQTSTKVPPAMSPATQETRKIKATADLPTSRYGLEPQIHQTSVRLGPLTTADLQQAAPDQIGMDAPLTSSLAIRGD